MYKSSSSRTKNASETATVTQSGVNVELIYNKEINDVLNVLRGEDYGAVDSQDIDRCLRLVFKGILETSSGENGDLKQKGSTATADRSAIQTWQMLEFALKVARARERGWSLRTMPNQTAEEGDASDAHFRPLANRILSRWLLFMHANKTTGEVLYEGFCLGIVETYTDDAGVYGEEHGVGVELQNNRSVGRGALLLTLARYLTLKPVYNIYGPRSLRFRTPVLNHGSGYPPKMEEATTHATTHPSPTVKGSAYRGYGVAMNHLLQPGISADLEALGGGHSDSIRSSIPQHYDQDQAYEILHTPTPGLPGGVSSLSTVSSVSVSGTQTPMSRARSPARSSSFFPAKANSRSPSVLGGGEKEGNKEIEEEREDRGLDEGESNTVWEGWAEGAGSHARGEATDEANDVIQRVKENLVAIRKRMESLAVMRERTKQQLNLEVQREVYQQADWQSGQPQLQHREQKPQGEMQSPFYEDNVSLNQPQFSEHARVYDEGDGGRTEPASLLRYRPDTIIGQTGVRTMPDKHLQYPFPNEHRHHQNHLQQQHQLQHHQLQQQQQQQQREKPAETTLRVESSLNSEELIDASATVNQMSPRASTSRQNLVRRSMVGHRADTVGSSGNIGLYQSPPVNKNMVIMMMGVGKYNADGIGTYSPHPPAMWNPNYAYYRQKPRTAFLPPQYYHPYPMTANPDITTNPYQPQSYPYMPMPYSRHPQAPPPAPPSPFVPFPYAGGHDGGGGEYQFGLAAAASPPPSKYLFQSYRTLQSTSPSMWSHHYNADFQARAQSQSQSAANSFNANWDPVRTSAAPSQLTRRLSESTSANHRNLGFPPNANFEDSPIRYGFNPGFKEMKAEMSSNMHYTGGRINPIESEVVEIHRRLQQALIPQNPLVRDRGNVDGWVVTEIALRYVGVHLRDYNHFHVTVQALQASGSLQFSIDSYYVRLKPWHDEMDENPFKSVVASKTGGAIPTSPALDVQLNDDVAMGSNG